MIYIKILSLSIILYCSLFSTASSYAGQVSDNEKNKAIEDFYEKSGLAKQIPFLSSQMEAHVRAYSKDISNKTLTKLIQELNKIFTPSILERRIKGNLKRNVSNRELLHSLEWFNSSIGRKAARLDELAYTPDGSKSLMAFLEQNRDTKLKDNRMILIKRLVDASNMTEMGVNISIFIEVTVLDLLNDLDPNTKPLSRETIKNYVDSQRSQIRAGAQKQTELSAYYIYQSLTESELTTYTEFMETDASRKVSTAIMMAIVSSIYLKHDLI